MYIYIYICIYIWVVCSSPFGTCQDIFYIFASIFLTFASMHWVEASMLWTFARIFWALASIFLDICQYILGSSQGLHFYILYTICNVDAGYFKLDITGSDHFSQRKNLNKFFLRKFSISYFFNLKYQANYEIIYLWIL